MPYTKEVFEQLKELFPEVEYTSPPTPLLEERGEIPPATEQNNENDNKVVLIKKSASKAPLYIKIKHEEVETKTLEKTSENKSAITVTVYSKIIEIKMPKDEADIQFIRSFKFAKWNTNHFCWTVPN